MASRGAICNWLSEAGLCLAQASAILAARPGCENSLGDAHATCDEQNERSNLSNVRARLQPIC